MTRSRRAFLLAYCKELTGLETTSLKRLFRAAVEGCPRAAEPVLLLALEEGRSDFLMRQARGTRFEARFRNFLEELERSGLPLDSFLATLPASDRFAKAHAAWVSELTRPERDLRTLQSVREKIGERLEDTGLSRAEACRVLNLNKGNFYAFLKGDLTKLSRATAINAYKTLANL